jgi:APA family basic amino acid/polyamine antiporter
LPDKPFWTLARERYLARKPPAAMRRQAEQSQLSKTLGVWELTALGIGAVIGAGIFTVIGAATATAAGPAVVVSFIVAAIVCAVAGLAYAELSAMLPLGGSAYTYAYATFGELVAWVLGWALVLEYAIGNMAVANGFSGNFASLLDGLGVSIPAALRAAPGAAPGGVFDLPAFLIVMLVTLLLLRPVKESARANAVLVVLKLAVLVLFLVVALPHVDAKNLQPFAPFGLNGIFAGAALLFFSFLGFDAVSTAAEETRNPQRDLPRGILLSLAVCTVIYILLGIGLTGIIKYSDLNVRDPLVLALRTLGMENLGLVMAVGGILATVSVLLVFQLGTSRIFYTLARDGMIPTWFTRVSPRFRTPTRITLVGGLFVAIGAALLPLTFLVQLTNVGTLFAFALVLGALLVLRRDAPDLPRPFRMPGSPWLPIVGILMCLGLGWFLGTLTLLGFVGWMGLGLMIYALYGARKSKLRKGIVLVGEPPDEPGAIEKEIALGEG